MILFVYLFVFLALLILGAWCVSEGGDILGSKYDATIIGGFVIAWLNTAPETIFFITALESGNPSFAVGAMTGSVIVVNTIAVGCCIIIGSANRKSGTIFLFPGVRSQALVLGISLLVSCLVLTTKFSYLTGCFGVFGYFLFILNTLFDRYKGTPKKSSEHGKDDSESEEEEEDQPTWKGILFLVMGGTLIYLCSEPFIHTVVDIGKSIDLNPIALAFFFAPIASEAPEILESISLSRKGKTQNINIAFSNLVGGTISKTTLLLGILCFYGYYRGFPWVVPSYTISFLMIIISAGATSLFSIGDTHGGIKGWLLIGLFFVFALVQFGVAYLYGDQMLNLAEHK